MRSFGFFGLIQDGQPSNLKILRKSAVHDSSKFFIPSLRYYLITQDF